MPSIALIVLAVAVVLGRVLVAPRWERLFGGNLARGEFEARLTGALEVHWSGLAFLSRISAFAGRDGYHLVLHGPTSPQPHGHTNHVFFSWTQRPRAGRYEIALLTDTTPALPNVIGGGIGTESLTPVAYIAHSGEMDITKHWGRLRGRFRMRCELRPTRPLVDSTGTVEAEGTFTLR